MEVRRWNSNIYPNLSFMSQFQQLRVIHPLAVNRTLVCTYSFRLRGAPEQMFHNTIRFANVVNGTGSLVLTDDLDIYNRIGLGISSEGAEWLQIGRGFQSDLPDEHGGRRGKNSTSEVYIRNMFDAWVGYMIAGDRGRRRRGSAAVVSATEAAAGLQPLRRVRTARRAGLRALSAARGPPARRRQFRRMAGAVHARCQLLGAERTRTEKPARHGVADL